MKFQHIICMRLNSNAMSCFRAFVLILYAILYAVVLRVKLTCNSKIRNTSNLIVTFRLSNGNAPYQEC